MKQESFHVPLTEHNVSMTALQKGFMGALVAFCVYILLSLDYFPYADANNHAARYFLLSELFFGENANAVTFSLLPTSYILIDVFAAFITWVFNAATAIKTVAFLAFFCLVYGFYRFNKKVNPSSAFWVIAILPLAFNWGYFYGFLNSIISIGCAFLWLSFWTERRNYAFYPSHILLGVAAIFIYFIHMAGAAFVLIYVGSEIIVRTIAASRYRKTISASIPLRELYFLLLVTFALGAFLSVTHLLGDTNDTASTSYSMQLEYRPIIDKMTHLASDLYIFSEWQFVFLVVVLLANGIFFMAQRRDGLVWLHPVTFCLFFLLLAYLVLPQQFLGAYDVDMRFLLPMYMLFFCLHSNKITPKTSYTAIPASLVSAYIIYLFIGHMHLYDQQLENYDRAISDLPKNSSVLGVVTKASTDRVDIYHHFIHWHVIKGQGNTNNLFDGASGKHLGHFTLQEKTYFPHDRWGLETFEPMSWDKVKQDYDYVLQYGLSGQAEEILSCRFGNPLKISDDFLLYTTQNEINENCRV